MQIYDHSGAVERLIELHEVDVQGPPPELNPHVPVSDSPSWMRMYETVQQAAAAFGAAGVNFRNAAGALNNLNSVLEVDPSDDDLVVSDS